MGDGGVEVFQRDRGVPRASLAHMGKAELGLAARPDCFRSRGLLKRSSRAAVGSVEKALGRHSSSS